MSGTAGSGKTVLGAQFLAAGISRGEAGVFVTFEERPAAIRSNVRSFGWDVEAWENAGKWCFVDASPLIDEDVSVSGRYDLAPLVARVTTAVRELGAQRVTLDSIGALLTQFGDLGAARRALFQVAGALEDLDVTSIMTSERDEDYGPLAVFGFEPFVADNVILLRNPLAGEKRRRTIEVLKLRGGSHAKGEHLFTLKQNEGIVVVPNAPIQFDYGSSTQRVTSGNRDLDRMLRGGVFSGSLVLISGPTGAGKSLLATQFIAGGVNTGERCLFHSFEESEDQIIRNAAGWGMDFQKMKAEGRLQLIAESPESASLEDHLLRIKSIIDEFQPDRVAIDSLTALERISTVKSFREYVLGLTFHVKRTGALGLFTATSVAHPSDASLTELHISTITDAIIVLQYVAVGGEMRRGLNVLKMRGSDHDKSLREFVITDAGLQLLEPFDGVTGMLTPTSAAARGL